MRDRAKHNASTLRSRKKNPGKYLEINRKSRKKVRAINRKALDEFYSMGCTRCGTKENIQAHHIGPKKFALSHGLSKSPITFKEEMKMCVPLCFKCHRETHRQNLDFTISICDQKQGILL